MVVPTNRAKVALRLASLGVVLFALIGCAPASNDFYLPPGDADLGLQAFQDLACTNCHSVANHSIPRPDPDLSIYVVLGGQSTQVKTYHELVTSIIHPNHRLSRGDDIRTVTPLGASRMKTYNEIMSVQQLIDIVEFLQPTYYVWPPDSIYQPSSDD